MTKLKHLLLIAFRAFGPIVTAIGAVMTVLSTWAERILGAEALWPIFRDNFQTVWMSLLIVGAVMVILRLEWRYREWDRVFGNEPKRKLLSEGIFPLQHEYIQRIRDGDFRIVNLFWDGGMVNLEDHGRTDLQIAAQAGHAAIVKGLLERGGDAKRPSRDGLTALMLASIGGHVKVADVLLDHDCGINAKSTRHGGSALFVAAAHGRAGMVEMLIKAGAEVDSVDYNNLTPLMAALAQSKWDVVLQLLDAGADPKKMDSSGATAADYAAVHNAPETIVQRLQTLGAKRSVPELRSSESGFSGDGQVRMKWQVVTDSSDESAIDNEVA